MSFLLTHGDALSAYDDWETPTAIISDGPYGVGGFDGDPSSVDGLQTLYEPHVKVWSNRAAPYTVLWFWGTELGWASMHPLLQRYDWIYHGCNIWDKGLMHIAGNCNGKTMRQFPVVTEVCVQYVRPILFKPKVGTLSMTAQHWLRSEWIRTGLPLKRANDACGLKNAASRKYLTKDHMFYFPPQDIFQKLVDFANMHGDSAGKPYFDLPGEVDNSAKVWDRIWYRFNFEYGVTNVWAEPALRSRERIKDGGRAIHLNQKPLALMNRVIKAVCQPGDVVWEPFGGLCTASVAALGLGCRPMAAELADRYYRLARARLTATQDQLQVLTLP